MSRRVTDSVAADGNWWALVERPVLSIEAGLYAQIDIDREGVGWVKLPKTGGPARIDVEYVVADEVRA
jgi:hypothetical protein